MPLGHPFVFLCPYWRQAKTLPVEKQNSSVVIEEEDEEGEVVQGRGCLDEKPH
jgi:hypothetical protein